MEQKEPSSLYLMKLLVQGLETTGAIKNLPFSPFECALSQRVLTDVLISHDIAVNAWILHDDALVANVLTHCVTDSFFKEEVPILVLTQALDSDDESLSSSPPPAIVLSPV